MKILLVADLGGWAIENRCKAIKKFLPQHDFDIFAERDKEEFLESKAKDYDLIHINFSYHLERYMKFIKDNGHKIIFTHSNQRTLVGGDGGNPKLMLEIMRSVAAITSVSKNIVDSFPDYKITYIPNGIDDDLFCKSKNLIVGYSGSQNSVKNFGVIKQACEELGLELKTTGNINREKGSQVVSKQIPFEQMNDFYMGLDVFVHASLSEGCNNCILEALSCNMPVLMTKTGIWQELEGYVNFIEPTVEGVKEGLRKFLGRRLINEKFLWKNIVPRYGEIYENALSKEAV